MVELCEKLRLAGTAAPLGFAACYQRDARTRTTTERPSAKPATRHGKVERPSGEVAPLSGNKYSIEKWLL